MADKMLSLLAMGTILLILFTILSFATIGQTYPGPIWLGTGWVGSLALTAFVLWQAETPRSAWGYLSLIGGIVSFALALVILFVPVSASAPYEPGADWMQAIDLTQPIEARLREALASAYLAIAIIVMGAVLLSLAFLLLHFRGPPRPQAH